FHQFSAGAWPFPVTVEGHRTHRELGRLFSASSAFFLCLEPPAARQLPAKLYEYLRSGRPTFAIVPKEGAAAEWLMRTGAGAFVDSATPASWVAVLKSFIEGLDRYVAPSPEPFLRRSLTQRLSQLLGEVAK